MALIDLFDYSLRGRPHAPALDVEAPGEPARTYTFGDLECRSNRLARALRRRGLEAGDRLALLLPNRVEVIDLWLACLKIGVIVVPINVLYREREVAHIVADAQPRAIVAAMELAGVCPTGATVWDVESLADAAAAEDDDARPSFVATAESPAALVYTSGTTGASKGAVLTHGNFAANALTLVTAWRITERDRYLAVLPLFHVHGLGNGVMCWLAAGCHMRLLARFDHTCAADVFEHYRPTLFFGVPTIYVRLLDVEASRARRIGASMRLFVSGSAPLPAHVLEQFREHFGHVILERYGMTETLMIASNPYTGVRAPGVVGPALPMMALRVVAPDGAECAAGTTGEVVVRGPNVCAGYWNRPEATAAAFVEGWFRTGDLGDLDEDGALTLRGRRSDVIISGGFNIYPREIEDYLLEQSGVREAAVVGVADTVRGEVPVAYLVADDDADVEAIDRAVATAFASFKRPRAYVRVESLPRTALGKVQKHLVPPWAPPR